MDPLDLRLDGNAAAGLFMDIFGRDMTEAITICAGCRAEHPVGRLLVYAHGMGTVIRCTSCGQVQMKVTLLSGAYGVDLRGVQVFRVARTPAYTSRLLAL